MTDFAEQARAVLAANDRGGYTVPAHGLYPFQWNWDSAFVAMGFALYDIDRACRELERLTEGQWADGMIPHIVFHAPSDTYYPGPEVWRTAEAADRPPVGEHVPPASARRPPTSGITQPPVFGMALRVLEARGAPRDRLEPLFDAALRWHRWWYRARDPEGTGLVALLHPWESGSDNSPAWDGPLARVPAATQHPVRRKDTGHVDPSMRPRDEDYRRFIHLVETHADRGWDPVRQWQAAPFRVACVQTSAILLAAGEDLEALARGWGRPEAEELAVFNALTRPALLARWSAAAGRFLHRDLLTGEDIPAPTQAGFIPLLALDLGPEVAGPLVAELRRWGAGMAVALPTTPAWDPAFEPRRYWRGPVWPIIDWLISRGLERNGEPALAAELRASVCEAMERAGFVEYFDPRTGEGLGGQGFSWSAAAYLTLRG